MARIIAVHQHGRHQSRIARREQFVKRRVRPTGAWEVTPHTRLKVAWFRGVVVRQKRVLTSQNWSMGRLFSARDRGWFATIGAARCDDYCGWRRALSIGRLGMSSAHRCTGQRDNANKAADRERRWWKSSSANLQCIDTSCLGWR